MVYIYLITLIISPQLWIEPFVDVRVDTIVYPLWMLVIIIQGKSNDFFNFTLQDKFFLLMLGWIIVSSVLNSSNQYTNSLIFDYIKWFFLYKFMSISIKDEGDLLKVLKFLVFLVIIVAVQSIQHKFSPNGIGWAGQSLGWVDQSVLNQGGTGRTQWINIFDGPGVFCVLFTLALPFTLLTLSKNNSISIRIIGLAATILLLYSIYYTGSRGGILATVSIFGLYFLFKSKLSLAKVAPGIVMIIVVFMLLPSHLTSTSDSNKSAQHRVDMWVEGIEMVQHNPVLGIGKGNFAGYTGRLIAHNSAIEIMGETGLPGLFFWLCLIYIGFRYLFLYFNQEEKQKNRELSQAIAICLTGYLVSSMFVTLEYETLYFILALTSVVGKQVKTEKIMLNLDYRRVLYILSGWLVVLKTFVMMYY